MDPAYPVPNAQGALTKTPWPHLLVYAFERKLTGTFELGIQGQPTTTLLVVQGMPAKIRTNDGLHRLGDILVELGVIAEADLAASQAHLSFDPDDGTTKKLHGVILQELGFSTPDELNAGLVVQLERKLDHLFDLPDNAAYAYFDGFDALASYGGAPTPVHPFRALARGILRSDVNDHVRTTLAKVEALGMRLGAQSELARFGFDEAAANIVDRLRPRPGRVADILANEGFPRPAIDKVLYCLVITKQIELVDPATLPATLAVDDEPPPSSASNVAPGRAFARVNLQAKSIVRSPLVIEEAPVPRGPNDSRLSSPPPPVAPRIPGQSDFPSLDAWNADGLAATDEPATPEEIALRRKITERAETISSQDYFQMLGIGREASDEAIQKAYFALVKTWHPDKLSPRLVDVKDACAKVFSYLSEAHATLSDDDKRAQYMNLLRDGGATPDDQAKIQSVLDASTAFQKAEFFLKRNDLTAAYEQASTAHRLDPEQADYLAMQTWLEALQPENTSPEATLEKIAIFDRCVVLKPTCERAYFWRGQLYKRVDMADRAVHDFRKVAELNPRNLDAVREVRLHEMRSGKSAKTASVPPPSVDGKESKSGFLGRLFKKT